MPYAKTRLGRWFYEERGAPRGSGDAILLLHSLLCDGGMWRGQLAPLAELGRVVVVDAPGHGQSDVPPPFTLDDHADALADLLSAAAIERVTIVGLSWGGMLGMRAALLYPNQVRAIALLDTSADAVPLHERIKYRAMIAFARRWGLPPSIVRSEVVPLMFAPSTRRARPELVESFMRSLGGYPREGVARATLAVSIDRPSIVDRIRGVRVPTLVVCGRDDRATPPAMSRTIAERIPGARLEMIDDAGHLSALERPESVNSVVVPFVRAHAFGR